MYNIKLGDCLAKYSKLQVMRIGLISVCILAQVATTPPPPLPAKRQQLQHTSQEMLGTREQDQTEPRASPYHAVIFFEKIKKERNVY